MEENKKLKLTIPVVPVTVNFKMPIPGKKRENKHGEMIRSTIDYTSIMVGFTQVPVEVDLVIEVDAEEWLTAEQTQDLKRKLATLARPFNEAALDGVMYLWREVCKMQDGEG